jgi:hypothetical protein
MFDTGSTQGNTQYPNTLMPRLLGIALPPKVRPQDTKVG